jgi:hypothetical protein
MGGEQVYCITHQYLGELNPQLCSVIRSEPEKSASYKMCNYSILFDNSVQVAYSRLGIFCTNI